MIESPKASGGEESVDFEGALRSPAQLAFVMPLIAVGGLMVVVSAAAIGASAQLVAIAAVGGFGLCAVAPMALVDYFVGRPLRAAAARLRAARDGGPIGESAPFAAGIVADLVHLADDLRAAHTGAGKYGATLSQCEKLLEAGEEAIRAFRQQSQALAQGAPGDDPSPGAGQTRSSENAEGAILPPAAPLEGIVERIESMLVYVGEALDRRETNDKVTEGAFGRVEQSVTDLGRLVARETEALQRSVSNSAVAVRNDLALAETEEEHARARVIERIETSEARLLAKLLDAAPPDAPRLTELIRAEAEATRRAVRESLEAATRKLDAAVLGLSNAGASGAAAPLGDLVARGVADIGERLRAETAAQAERLEAVESRVVQQILAIERDAETTTLTALMRTTKQLGEAIQKLEAAGAAKSGDGQGFGAQLQELGKSVEAIASRLEAAVAPLAAEARDAFAAAPEQIASLRDSLEAAIAEIKAASERGGLPESLRAEIEALGERLSDGLAQALAEKIAAASEAQSDALAARLQAFERDGLASALEALQRGFADLPAKLGEAAERIDRGAEKLETADIASLRSEIVDLAAKVSLRFDDATRDFARRLADAVELRQGEFEPAVAAIQAVTAEFCKAGAQLSASADALKLAAADRPAFAALREDVAAVAAALASLGGRAYAA